MIDYVVLSLAAFLAGGLNAIAGGGSFLTFPALVFTGVPTIAANATSAVAVFPGYLSGAAGFQQELRGFPRRTLIVMLVTAVIGGVLGGLLLLVTTAKVFTAVVPWLLGFATLVFALGPRISAWAARIVHVDGPLGQMATMLVCIYGGYFNGGLGIVLLALLSALGMRDINLMNGLKNGLSFILSGASVITFAIAGLVFWPQAIVMMCAATIGGYVGAIVARRLNAAAVRAIVVGIGIAMTAAFALRT